MTIKFKSFGERSRGQSWTAFLPNGVCVTYGWSFMSNGVPFASNMAAHGHVYAQVQYTSNNGNTVDRVEELYRQRLSSRTYRAARRDARPYLANAKAAAAAFAEAQPK